MKISKKHSVRLSKHVVPERYRLMLRPNLEQFTFVGEETIYLTVRISTREVVLHSKELDVESAKFKVRSAEWDAKILYNEKAETVTLRFNQVIPKGKGELRLVFRGLLTDKMRGFYRSKYTHGKKEKYMATTQFEATDARRAFPCFDEPAQKAIFDVTLQIPGHTMAISNTLETAVKEHEGGYKIVQFAPTPKMSTYLLAFIVGEFEYIEGRTKDNVLVRIFVTPGKKHQATFALETAIKSLEFYNDYFKIPYPLPVLDLIAIPDFNSAAMENWGAVTYRESALLVDAEKTSAANKQWVAIVIAHELAHQWFGNLVTMEWWTDLWLNEGFASYMEYLAVDALFPEWDMWTQFVSGRFSHALELDALKNTHPIEIEVHHPDEISEIFDSVSYAKGSSVIRMLAEYLGEKDFRDGLRHYLKKFSYRNATTKDLWLAFEHVSKKPVRKIMQQWTKAPGYPLIKITEKPKGLQLSQTRYFSSALSKKAGNDRTIWNVPVHFTGPTDTKPKKYLLTTKTALLPIAKEPWIKINAGETSFFRTDYPTQMLQAFRPAIEKKRIGPADRLSIIRDAFALAESLELPTVQALQLAESYIGEDDYTVWSELVSGIGTVGMVIRGEPSYPAFEAYARQLFKPITERLGWEKKPGEKHTVGLLRNLMLSSSSHFGNPDVIRHAQTLFAGKKPLPSDIRGAVYTAIARHGGMKEFTMLLKRYKAEALHEEKDRIARALAAFQDKKVIERMLAFTISDDVRIQDTPFYLGAVLRNYAARDIAWAFIKKNWKLFLKRYDAAMSMLDRIITPAGNFAHEKDVRDFESFFKKHPAPGASRTIEQTLERIRSNAAWLSREGDNIERWLNRKQ